MKKSMFLLIFIINNINTAKENKFDESIFNWTKTFAEAIDILQNKFYKDFDPTQPMIKAINAFVSLEPHSCFLDPKSYNEILKNTNKEFFGIGVTLSNHKNKEENFLVILNVLPGSPAEKAGIKAGDKIIEINNLSLKGITTDEAANRLKGPKDSIVNLKIHRKNNADFLKFNIKRDLIKEPNSVYYYLKDYNIYYIGLNLFSKNAAADLSTLLKKIKNSNYKALILDLRNNSGGLLPSAVEIAELFLEKNSLIVTAKYKNKKEVEKFVTTKEPIIKHIPLIFILINTYTASSAEILAGALKFHSEKNKNFITFLAGTKTFGKGSVQEIIPLSNECAIKTTVALYHLPDGNTIQGIGIEPDFYIEMKYPPNEQQAWINKFYGKESSLIGAIEIKNHPSKEKKETKEIHNWNEQKREALSKDYQLKKTVELINMYYLAPEYIKNDRNKIKSYITKQCALNNLELV